MNTEPDPPEDPAIREYKASIASIRTALETETDPAILEDLKDALECECHSAFMYEMLSDAPPPTPEPAEESPENTHPVPNKLSDAIKADIEGFITAARTCIHQLLENSAYVRQELPNVGLPDALRREVEKLCDTWLDAKHDALSDLHELAEAADTNGADDPDLVNRCRQINGILGGVFEPTDHVVRQLREAAFKDPGLGLAALLVMESARNIMVTIPAFVVKEECAAEESEDDDSPGEPDDEESGEGCYGFHAEDSYPVGQLIEAIRGLMERPELPAETLEELRVFLFAMERMPLVTPGVRMSLGLRLDQGGESDWREIRMDDEEFTLERGAWIQGDAHTEIVFQVGPDYRDGDAFAASGFAESFLRCAEDVCREVVIDDNSGAPFTGWDLGKDRKRWGSLPCSFL